MRRRVKTPVSGHVEKPILSTETSHDSPDTSLGPVVRHTCVGDGGVLVQGHQGRVQQDDVGVLGDHPVVGRLDPRLVLVHCGREREKNQRTLIFCC